MAASDDLSGRFTIAPDKVRFDMMYSLQYALKWHWDHQQVFNYPAWLRQLPISSLSDTVFIERYRNGRNST